MSPPSGTRRAHCLRRSSAYRTAIAATLVFLTGGPLLAGPWLTPGDPWLKADILVLADAGIITSPVSSWPLSWGDIAQDINAFTSDVQLDAGVSNALLRVRNRARAELVVGQTSIDGGLRVAEKPVLVRGFHDAPRGEQELWVAAERTGERFAFKVRGSYVNDDPTDTRESRLDGSYAALAIGNWMLGASLIDRWWGPGWNGSLILSNAARPIPSLVIERNFSTPFESKWLSWIGPWSTSVIWGELGTSRAVPNTRFFGWRVNFRPFQSLEIGALRTAQWCGDGRECDLDAFAKVLVGDSNVEAGQGTDVANQLAGFDARWSPPFFGLPVAVYAQLIGEDEAGGFPSRYLGQFGVEAWGFLSNRTVSWRAYAEYADTTCQFNESSKNFNCAYNNGSYPTGYRFRGRSIGHSSDNDAQSVAFGLVANDLQLGEWSLSIRHFRLNRGGPIDSRNTVTASPQDLTDIDIVHRRSLDFVDLEFGVGAEKLDDKIGNSEDTNLRVFVGAVFRL